MGYSDAMEMLSERYHTTKPTLIALNSPTTKLAPGAKIKVPNVRPAVTDYPGTLKPEWRATLAGLSVSSDQPKAAKLVVDKSDKVLRAYDDQGKLIAQFPATMGSEHDPLPIGNWKIQGISPLPSFHYNPALFWDAKPGDEKQTLKPGPNGPVGVVWMDLDKPHYGIHGTSTPETIDMGALVRGVADSLRHRAAELGAKIDIATGLPSIVSDRLAVEQILSNLVENSVKYLKPGRPGKIEVRGERQPGRVVFEVVDNGRGIDPRDHERVFDLFRRSGQQDQPGEGIGLAHVRALAYRLGGTIDVASELGSGATFRVNLPAVFAGEQGGGR